MTNGIQRTFATLCVLGLAAFGCGSDQIAPKTPIAIGSFSAAPDRLAAGSSATLSWSVTGDLWKVEILRGGEALHEASERDGTFVVEALPEGRSRFVLVAHGQDGGTKRAEAEVVGLDAPTIVSFSPNREEAPAGGAVFLSWRTLLADTVELSAGGASIGTFAGAAATEGSVTVRPTAETTYTLKATGVAGTDEKTVTVRVNEAPAFDTSTVSPSTVAAGESVTVTWATQRATSVSVKDGARTLVTAAEQEVASGSRTFVVTTSRTFTLVATGPGGTESIDLPVTVVAPARVDRFVAAPSEIVVGGSVTLSWTTADAQELTLTANGDPVEVEGGLPAGSVTLTPETTTVYELAVAGPGGEGHASLQVTVHGQPVIGEFDAVPRTRYRRREPAVLQWRTSGAVSVSVSTTDDEVVDLLGANPAAGSAQIFPEEDTTYILTAVGPGGTVESAPILVEVLEPPPLVELSLLRNPINRGMTSELAWRIVDADTFSVAASTDGETFTAIDIGTRGADDAIPTTPEATTTYRITATNTFGTTEKTVTQTVVNPPAFTKFETNGRQHGGPNAVSVTMEEPFTVTWATTDAYGVLFDPGRPYQGYTASGTDTDRAAAVAAFDPRPHYEFDNLPYESIEGLEGTQELQVPTSTTAYVAVTFGENFLFPFFGSDFSVVQMAASGYLCFGSTGSSTPCSTSASTVNEAIPNSAGTSGDTPDNIIAPFWDSLKTVSGQTKWLWRMDGAPPNRTVTLEWARMELSTPAGEEISFKVVLYESGYWEIWNAPRTDITSATDNARWGASATVGVENALGQLGHPISFNSTRALCSSFTPGASGTPAQCTPITRIRPKLLPPSGSTQLIYWPTNFVNNTRTIAGRAFGPLGAAKSDSIVATVNRKPTTVALTASRSHIGAGESVRFDWTGIMNPAIDWDHIELRDSDGGLVPVPNPSGISGTNIAGNFTFVPTKTSTYTLVALNKALWEEKSTPVTVVVGPPTLEGVQVSPTSGAMRDPYTITWTESNGLTSMRLEDPDGVVVFDLAASAVATRRITRTDLVKPGTYTLVAVNASGETRRTFDLAIDTAVRIVRFVADTDEQTTGKPVKFTWETFNGTSLRILANGTQVHTSTVISDIRGLPPEFSSTTVPMGPTDTEFVLEVTGATGTVTKAVTVRAAPTPEVLEFITEPTTPDWGQPFKLKWKTRNATVVRVQRIATANGPNTPQGQPTSQLAVVGDFPVDATQLAEGEVTVTIRENATFRVIAENRVGDIDEERLSRNPRRGAATLSFNVTPATGSPRGGYADLSWSASQVDGVQLWKREASEFLQVPYAYVPFGFTDISTTGTELTMKTSADAANYQTGYATVAFPNAFRPPYFGVPIAGMLVSSRGIITLSDNPNDLTKNGCVNPVPTGMPTSFGCGQNAFAPGNTDERPDAFLAPFQGNLSACSGQTTATTCAARVGGAPNLPGKVHWQLLGQAPTRVLVVQWTNWDFATTTAKGTLTFQAKLYENGDSEFQYKRLFSLDAKTGGGDQGILGIESPDGKQYVHLDKHTGNDPLVFDGDGYRFFSGLQPLERPAASALRSRFITETSTGTVVNYRASVATTQTDAPAIPKAHPVLPGDLIINEILVDSGDANDVGKEWIEIRNRGGRANLKDYTITTASTFDKPFTFTQDLFIEQNTTVLIAQSTTPSQAGNANVAAVYGTDVRMNNIADSVILRHGDILIDRVEYDKTAGWQIPRGRSLMLDGRARSASHNDVPSMWCSGYAASSQTSSAGALNDNCFSWAVVQGGYDATTDLETVTAGSTDPSIQILSGTPSSTVTSQKFDVPIGFEFPYFGERYTDLDVSYHGFVALRQMGSSLINSPTTSWPTSPTTPGLEVIAPLWASLTNRTGTTYPPAVRAMTVGEAPNRRFIVNWAGYRLSSTNTNVVDMSLVLTEKGEIEFHYKGLTPSTATVAVGMEAFSNGAAFLAFAAAANATNSANSDLTQLPPAGSVIKLVRRE